jgi:oligosaccharide repeat unit polymerase
MFEIKKYQKLFNLGFYIVMFFLLANLKFENDSTFIICQIVYIGYLLMIILILKSNIFKYVYEPPIFFLLFAFLYEFLKFPYYFNYTSIPELVQQSKLGTPYYEIKDYYANSIMLLLYQALCILTLLTFYIFARNKTDYKNIDLNKIKLIGILNDRIFVFLVIVFLCLGFLGLYSVTGGNILLLLSRRSGNAEASDILSSNYLVSFSSIFVLLTIPMLIGVRFLRKKKWLKLLVIYIPAMILSYLTTGARGFILYSIVTTFIIIASDFKTKVNLIKIATFTGFFVLFFSVLGLIRRSSSDIDNSFIQSVKNRSEVEDQWYYELSSYQLQFRDEMVFENASKVGYLYGKTYLNLVFFPFPRAVLGDLKPNFTDREVAVNFWNRFDVGLPLNSMTESYYNFGYFGIFVFMFMGIVMSKITVYISKNKFLIIKCMAIVLLFYAQTWTTTYLVYVFQYILVIYLPLKFSKFKSLDE